MPKLLKKLKGKLTFKKVLLWLILLFLLVAVIGLASILFLIKDLPSPQALGARQVVESTKIYDRTEETLLYELFEEEKRTVVPFDQIPDHVKEATIAIEDANFYQHKAIDLKGIIRAVFVNLTQGGIRQGGSTITQQLAKNAFLSADRTFSRKAKELILAFRLENRFSKDQILALYLNQIPYGGNAYGIESASRTYFEKSVEDLSLAETALLASLPQAPSYYSPWGSHVDELMERKNFVLKRMEDLGYISEEEKLEAQEEELEFSKVSSSVKAPHFSIAVQEYLSEKYGEDFVRRAGLKVITTLDWELQEIAEEVVKEGVERNNNLYNGTNGALLAQDTDTGQILAMVGSKDYFDSDNEGNFNVATLGLRQPGSALKPFAYLTAFKKGFTPETILFDALTEFNANSAGSYQPHNFDNIFRGPVAMRTALAQSINVPAVKTLYLAGMGNVLSLMEDFGVTTLNDPSRFGLSLVLGGGEVTLMELLGAYSTLAEEGIYHPQSMILRIEDRDGKVLEEFEDEPKRVIAPKYPRMVNDILTDLNARAGLFQSSFNLTVFPGYDVALKTGTTNDYRDAWAFGYTPNFAVGVWAGNNNNTPMTAQGSSILAAVPMWNAFLSEALKTREPEVFPGATQQSPEKPVLRGESVVVYEDGGNYYPQVHNILFYVDKSEPEGPEPRYGSTDSQFENWESAVVSWASANMPGFNSLEYNQTIPSGARIAQNAITGLSQGIQFINPKNGDNIDDDTLQLSFDILLEEDIAAIEIYLNNNLLDQREGFFSNSYSYDSSLDVSDINLRTQNTLKVVVADEDGNVFENEIVLFN
ncbi:MAG: PBP1A family penicillin-binding protein [bacterium]|nr:PBP1A family penicillin-binding protein [bacterium]